MLKRFWKKSSVRLLLAFSCLLLISLGSWRIYQKLTDGFSVDNISSSRPYNPSWQTAPLVPDEQKKIQQILGQKFYYLGKGCQNYVFLSEDSSHVIKFFKQQHLQLSWWLRQPYIPFHMLFKGYVHHKKQQKQEKLYLLFNGARLAYEKLKGETGVVFLHLNKTDESWLPHLQIIDKIGRQHILELNTLEFYVQKRADSVYPIITSLATTGNTEQIQKIFASMVRVLVDRSKKGIADKDPALIQNIGLTAEGALIVDVGQLVEDSQITNSEVYKQDILNRSRPFKKWLAEHHPDLVPLFEQALQV